MKNIIADKVFINGIILTQDADTPRVSQLATQGKAIIATGNDLSDLVTPETQTIDLKGAVMVPGFIDAHLHFLWGGESLLTIPAHDAHSKREFIEIVRRYASGRQAGSWLKGSGWNEHHFTDNSFPHRSWLDEAAPGHPMILTRHDGHSGIASSAALELAGITSNTQDPEGGVIDRDAQGNPTGIVRDAAIDMVMAHMPEASELELRQYLDAAQDYLLEKGVTCVGDMIYDMHHFSFLQDMARQGHLKVRINAYTPILKWQETKELIRNGIYEDEYFQYKGLKAFCDGSLGSHTALMLEPYDDTPDSAGIYDSMWSDVSLIKKTVIEADMLGYQTVIHAIGDRAVREVLDLFEEIIQKNGFRDRRFRIEHAQHIHPQDLPRFGALGIIPSVQPAHCVDDSLYGNKLLGDRCAYAYPFHSLHQTGAALALGSDWPVSPADPAATIHAAVHRAGWYMNEALGFDESLKAHTADTAFAGFREHDLGILKAGHLADLTILDPGFLKLDEKTAYTDNLVQKVFVNGEEV